MEDVGLDPLQELAFSKYRIAVILECRGLWINEEAYGLSWNARQIKVFPPKSRLPMGSVFLDDLEAVREHIPEVPKPTPVKETSEVGVGTPPLINYLVRDE